MMIKYKIDIIQALKEKGYNTGRIKREKILPGQTLTNITDGKSISLDTLNKICCLLRCQPGDLIGWEATDDEKIKYF